MTARKLSKDVSVAELLELRRMGFTKTEIAKQLGVRTETVSAMLKGYEDESDKAKALPLGQTAPGALGGRAAGGRARIIRRGGIDAAKRHGR